MPTEVGLAECQDVVQWPVEQIRPFPVDVLGHDIEAEAEAHRRPDRAQRLACQLFHVGVAVFDTGGEDAANDAVVERICREWPIADIAYLEAMLGPAPAGVLHRGV